MRINLKKLSFDELLDLKSSIDKTLSKKTKIERRSLQQRLDALDGFGRGKSQPDRRTGKVAPKYRNPNKRSETWSGRGRMPLWLVAMKKRGRKLEDFAIGKGSAKKAKAKKRGRPRKSNVTKPNEQKAA